MSHAPASRAARHAPPRRPRRLATPLAAAALMVLVVAVGLFLRGGGEPAPNGSPTTDAPAGASDLMVFSITGARHAYIAVIGSGGGRPASAIVMEPGTVFEVPGGGEATLEQIGAGLGDSMRIAIANAIGAWIPRFAVTDLDHFASMLDRQGGLDVNLPDTYTVADSVLGPGSTPMSGIQVATLLRSAGDDASLRFASVLQAFLATGPEVRATDLLATGDATGVAESFVAAEGATVQVSPTRVVAGTVRTPLEPDFETMVHEAFGTGVAVRVLVQNGSGSPGVGEGVARLLLPAGFRIVLSQNADSFDHETTQILATGDAHVEEARLVRDLLGVGVVKVSQVPSGLGDVTIIVGKDFEG